MIPVLLLANAVADGNTMDRYYLNTTEQQPKCIDGSPAIAYLAQNQSSKQFIFWLEGGGICKSLSDCQGRAQGSLGSSLGSTATIQQSRPMLMDTDENPDFRTWNRIYVPYTSGDVWSGNKAESLNPFPQDDGSGWKGYFHGHKIVEAVLNMTRDDYTLTDATDVILTGCSAGGIGTFFNCDFVAEYMKALNPNTRVSCRPEAGWFGLPIKDYNSYTNKVPDPDPRYLASSNWTSNIQPWTLESSEGKRCIEDVESGKLTIPNCTSQQLGSATCCTAVPILYPYIRTPLYVSENTADSFQVFSQARCPKAQTEDAYKFTEYLRGVLGGSLQATVANGNKQHQDGMFAPACLRHCMEWVEKTADINGRSHAQAYGDWYFGRGGTNMTLNETTDITQLLSCSDITSDGRDFIQGFDENGVPLAPAEQLLL